MGVDLQSSQLTFFYTKIYPQVLPSDFVQDPLSLTSIFVQVILKFTSKQVFEDFKS